MNCSPATGTETYNCTTVQLLYFKLVLIMYVYTLYMYFYTFHMLLIQMYWERKTIIRMFKTQLQYLGTHVITYMQNAQYKHGK